MILDCNNLLVDCYFQNVVYLAFSGLSLGLLSAATCPICHCLHACWDIHMSSLPRPHNLPSSLLSLTLLQVFSQRMLKHHPMSSDHPRYSLWPWKNTGFTQREDRMKNESPPQVCNMRWILRQEQRLAFIIFQWCGNGNERRGQTYLFFKRVI